MHKTSSYRAIQSHPSHVSASARLSTCGHEQISSWPHFGSVWYGTVGHKTRCGISTQPTRKVPLWYVKLSTNHSFKVARHLLAPQLHRSQAADFHEFITVVCTYVHNKFTLWASNSHQSRATHSPQATLTRLEQASIQVSQTVKSRKLKVNKGLKHSNDDGGGCEMGAIGTD